MEERLEVPHRGREPRGLLDLEHELPGGDPVRARGDDQEVRRTGERGRDRTVRPGAVGARRMGRLDPVAEPSSESGPVRRPAREQVRGDDGGDHRRHVADRVAPAAVHLDRGQHDVGDRGGRGPGARRQERGPRPCGHGGVEGRDRGRSAALVTDADHEAAPRRVQRELEGLGGGGTGTRQPGRAPRLPEDLRRALGSVLRGAAAGDDHRATGHGRLADRGREARRGPVAHEARHDPGRERGLGGDHLGHRPRRPVAQVGHREVVPGVRRGGQRGVGVEGAELGAEVVHRRSVGEPPARRLSRVTGRDASGDRGRRRGPEPVQGTNLWLGLDAPRRSAAWCQDLNSIDCTIGATSASSPPDMIVNVKM